MPQKHQRSWGQIDRYFPTHCILIGRCSALYYRARRWWAILRGHTGRTWRAVARSPGYRMIE